MTLEADIKTCVVNHLIEKNMINQSDSLINEFTYGRFSRRIDIAFIHNNEFYGIEIKSEHDSLARLGGQVTEYSKVFDKIIVVAAKKHINKARSILPKSIALWEYENNTLKISSRGRKKKITDKSTLIDLMRLSDLIKVARTYKIDTVSQNRKSLSLALLRIPTSKLRAAALQSISRRYSDNTKLFFKATKARKATPQDLSLLSKNDKRDSNNDISKAIIDINSILLKLP